ncbi:DNA alkylation repair protein [Actinomadura rugatobispora]|uniref:DNA alkylation repair protein n=1 Tax=Actinomadura rugatobispora TaxID=1994 RepID=A0ABW1A527_9ACTN|nr:DNA alkylation repair protein [Actinomadura rugatobispora]
MDAVAEETSRIVAELREQGARDRAEYEKRYLKSDFVHFGVPVPAIRKTARSAVRTRPARADLLALAASLWGETDGGRPVHEARVAAIEVLVRRVDVLEPGDLTVAESMIRDSGSWVYVDILAEKVVGALVVRFPDLAAVLDAWAGDPYPWIRRTALLALLPGVRAGHPDLDRVSRYGDALIEETGFFIRKALGWVLRELSKKDPAWVRDWVEPRTGRISGVTLREAVRHLPEDDAAPLLAAYQRR